VLVHYLCAHRNIAHRFGRKINELIFGAEPGLAVCPVCGDTMSGMRF
jgi:hypothetical protein